MDKMRSIIVSSFIHSFIHSSILRRGSLSSEEEHHRFEKKKMTTTIKECLLRSQQPRCCASSLSFAAAKGSRKRASRNTHVFKGTIGIRRRMGTTRAKSAPTTDDDDDDDSQKKRRGVVEPSSVTLVLLAGGVGKRMGANMPKQYLPLLDVPIAVYSLRKFATMEEVGEIVVVCNEDYDEVFTKEKIEKPISIARPGAERQDSVFNGISKARKEAKLLAIHDSARPLTDLDDARRCFEDGAKHGAAVLAVKCKATIKQANEDGSIDKTLDRNLLWEMQTPQVIEPNLLKEGFQFVKENGLEVTDDVSVVEHLGKRVQITEGSYYNIKVTTPEDMFIAERLLNEEPKLRCV